MCVISNQQTSKGISILILLRLNKHSPRQTNTDSCLHIANTKWHHCLIIRPSNANFLNTQFCYAEHIYVTVCDGLTAQQKLRVTPGKSYEMEVITNVAIIYAPQAIGTCLICHRQGTGFAMHRALSKCLPSSLFPCSSLDIIFLLTPGLSTYYIGETLSLWPGGGLMEWNNMYGTWIMSDPVRLAYWTHQKCYF